MTNTPHQYQPPKQDSGCLEMLGNIGIFLFSLGAIVLFVRFLVGLIFGI